MLKTVVTLFLVFGLIIGVSSTLYAWGITGSTTQENESESSEEWENESRGYTEEEKERLIDAGCKLMPYGTWMCGAGRLAEKVCERARSRGLSCTTGVVRP